MKLVLSEKSSCTKRDIDLQVNRESRPSALKYAPFLIFR
jgi:hypothetical protein